MQGSTYLLFDPLTGRSTFTKLFEVEEEGNNENENTDDDDNDEWNTCPLPASSCICQHNEDVPSVHPSLCIACAGLRGIPEGHNLTTSDDLGPLVKVKVPLSSLQFPSTVTVHVHTKEQLLHELSKTSNAYQTIGIHGTLRLKRLNVRFPVAILENLHNLAVRAHP